MITPAACVFAFLSFLCTQIVELGLISELPTSEQLSSTLQRLCTGVEREVEVAEISRCL